MFLFSRQNWIDLQYIKCYKKLQQKMNNIVEIV